MMNQLHNNRRVLVLSAILLGAAVSLALGHGLAEADHDHGVFACQACEWSKTLWTGNAGLGLIGALSIIGSVVGFATSLFSPTYLRPSGRSPPRIL